MADINPSKIITDKSNDFTPTWDNRRKVIFWSLLFGAVSLTIFEIILIIRLIFPLFIGSELDIAPIAASLITTIYITVSGAMMTIIGMYVFGVNFDQANFRHSTINLMSALNNPQTQPTVLPVETTTSITTTTSPSVSTSAPVTTQPNVADRPQTLANQG